MKNIIKGLLAAVALTAIASAPAKASVPVPITDGGGWNEFYFGGVGSSFQDILGDTLDFTFTLTKTTALIITDGFNPGDQFDVVIFGPDGVQVGTTSASQLGFTYVGDCWSCAYYNPAYNTIFSNGEFILGPGSYSVTGDAIASPEFSGEAALALGGVPEPATWAMMLAGFGGLGAALRHNRRRRASAATA